MATYASPTAIAITSYAGLGNGAYASSAIVSNTTGNYDDAIVGGSVQVGTPGSGVQTLDFYITASWDDVNFTGGADAGDGAISWGTTGNTHISGNLDIFKLGTANVSAGDSGADIRFGPFSVAQACGGTMPRRWAVVHFNNSGAAHNGTGTNNNLQYSGVTYP